MYNNSMRRNTNERTTVDIQLKNGAKCMQSEKGTQPIKSVFTSHPPAAVSCGGAVGCGSTDQDVHTYVRALVTIHNFPQPTDPTTVNKCGASNAAWHRTCEG